MVHDNVGGGVVVERESHDGASPGSGCPDEQVILDLALGALSPEDRRAAWAHVERCTDCERLVGAALPFLGPVTPSQADWERSWQRSVAPSSAGVSASGEVQSDADTVPGPATSALPPPRSLRPGQLLRNRYNIVRYIGRGAMGEVYEARHVRLVGRYAVKILNVDLSRDHIAQRRFEREATIASELRHANIVQVFDFDETDEGRPYLVMELLEGRDLGALIAEGPMPLPRVLALARQMAAGLSVMHGLDIVHRDLKPANVFVLPAMTGEPERAKLVDFGLSKRLAPSLRVTHDRMLLGTPQYMAPEQARASGEGVGPAADQFAMAAIIYEMLAGQPAFDGERLAIVLYRIVHESPPPLGGLIRGLPPGLLAAIDRALAKDPNQRFPSVTAFFDALESAAVAAPEGGVSAGPASPAATLRHRRSIKWAGVSASGAAAALGLLWLWLHPHTAPLIESGRAGAAAAPQSMAPGTPAPQQGAAKFQTVTGEAQPASAGDEGGVSSLPGATTESPAPAKTREHNRRPKAAGAAARPSQTTESAPVEDGDAPPTLPIEATPVVPEQTTTTPAASIQPEPSSAASPDAGTRRVKRVPNHL